MGVFALGRCVPTPKLEVDPGDRLNMDLLMKPVSIP